MICHAARHVNGKARDDAQVAVNVQKHALYAAFGTHHGAAGKRQRTIKPRGKDHAAVAFGVELFVVTLYGDLRAALYAERRGIAVRGDNLHAVIVFRHGERQNRRAVARRKVALALFERPGFVFKQANAARIFQHYTYIFHRMKTRRRSVDKLQQLFGGFRSL